MKKVYWSKGRTTYAVGRNGMSTCIGVDVFASQENSSLELSPVNSRNQITNCRIAIPINAIPEIINALNDIYRQRGV
jgi:hypothetical protein